MTKNIYQLYYYNSILDDYAAFLSGPYCSIDEAMKNAAEKARKYGVTVYLGMFMSHMNVLMKIDNGHWKTVVRYEL